MKTYILIKSRNGEIKNLGLFDNEQKTKQILIKDFLKELSESNEFEEIRLRHIKQSVKQEFSKNSPEKIISGTEYNIDIKNGTALFDSTFIQYGWAILQI